MDVIVIDDVSTESEDSEEFPVQPYILSDGDQKLIVYGDLEPEEVDETKLDVRQGTWTPRMCPSLPKQVSGGSGQICEETK